MPYSTVDIMNAVAEQNAGKPAALLEVGALYFAHNFKQISEIPPKTYRVRFSNLIGGGWCDIVLDTRLIRKEDEISG